MFFYLYLRMGLVVYSLSEYIRSRSTQLEKIKAIESLIDLMLDKMVDAIDDSGVAEYQLDDGQMKIRTQYRSVDEIMKGIQALEVQLNIYKNRYNGRAYVMRSRLNY